MADRIRDILEAIPAENPLARDRYLEWCAERDRFDAWKRERAQHWWRRKPVVARRSSGQAARVLHVAVAHKGGRALRETARRLAEVGERCDGVAGHSEGGDFLPKKQIRLFRAKQKTRTN